MDRGFDWNDLRFFLAVARAGTVSLAARRLGVDHATVIRRIDGLEHALGAKIFERNPRGYNVTQKGEKLLASAQMIESEAQKAEQELAGSHQTVSGLVRISSLEGFGNFFLASRLPRFTANHPNITLELLNIQQIVALSRREADLAITLQPPETGRFVRERLTDYMLFVYGSRAYLDNAKPIRTREDFIDHPFSGYIDDLVFTRGLDYLHEVKPGLRARIQSSSLHAQMEAACAGFGLCILPAFIAAHRPELVPVLPQEVALKRSYWLVADADAAMSSRIRAVRHFIFAEVAEAQALFV
ncbi:LysR family transcriptional regulator [Beijerinckia indica]|uniref:Transcriptional regulator, LysR family n=1 Tax=Beijerinckia indica subsp. indica (strain ATCC 9039 / DSM 1715 / NCIMB 8712) TaxID=395963 RepID=B2IBV8_BEII9|nr:LysR family transcriptional regulator [Beijerinckia indica]ACB93830.1 transcriptional regulator, LysR family [Beijerinckia indica subsp. indica ATCC 9039]